MHTLDYLLLGNWVVKESVWTVKTIDKMKAKRGHDKLIQKYKFFNYVTQALQNNAVSNLLPFNSILCKSPDFNFN